VDWTHIVVGGLSAAVGAVGGLVGGTWRVARIEPNLRLELQKDMAGIENDMRDQVTNVQTHIEQKIDGEMEKFRETVSGIREKVNTVERDVIVNYISSQYFERCRLEAREDFQRIEGKLDRLLERGI